MIRAAKSTKARWLWWQCLVVLLLSFLQAPSVIAGGDIKWSFTADESATGKRRPSPVMGADGTLYWGTDKLYALASDGTVKWTFDTGTELANSPSLGPDGTIYVVMGYRVIALWPDGTQKWNYLTDDHLRSSVAIGADGSLYVTGVGKLHALSHRGVLKWTYYVNSLFSSYSTPAIAGDGTVYLIAKAPILPAAPMLYAIAPNGIDRWSVGLGTTSADFSLDASPAIAADGTIYAGVSYSNGEGRLYAVNPDGSLKWTAFGGGNIGEIHSSPTIGSGGVVYIGTGFNPSLGYLLSVDPSTGDLIDWPSLPAPANGSPTIGNNDILYLGADDNHVYALNSLNGDYVWDANSSPLLDASVQSSPLIGPNGMLYVSTASTLYAITSESNSLADTQWPMQGRDLTRSSRAAGDFELQWLYDFGVTPINTLSMGVDQTYYVTSEFGLHAIRNGRQQWFFTSERPAAPLVSSKGVLLVGSSQNALHALNPDGSVKWEITGLEGRTNYQNMAEGVDGTLYFSTIDAGLNTRIHAVSPEGVLLWTSAQGLYAPVIGLDNRVYAGSATGHIYVLDPEKGSHQQFSNIPAAGDVVSIAAAADGSIYYCAQDALHALNEKGEHQWKYPSSGGTGCYINPVIGGDGTIFLGGPTHLTALNPANGSLKWSAHLGGDFTWVKSLGASVGDDGTIYAGAQNRLVAVNVDGTVKWRFSLQGEMISAPIIDNDGAVSVSSSGGFLYVINTTSSSPADSFWPMRHSDAQHSNRGASLRPFVWSNDTLTRDIPVWNWLGGAGAEYRVKLDGPDLGQGAETVFGSISGHATYKPSIQLSDGYHTLYVQRWDPVTKTWSNTGSYTVLVDTWAPFTTPIVSTGNLQSEVALACFDPNSDIASGCDQSFFSLDGGISFQLYSEPVALGLLDSFHYKSIDKVGNEESVEFLQGDQLTSTALELSSQTILQLETLDVTGKLTRLPEIGLDLSGLPMDIEITPPDGAAGTLQRISTDTPEGHFQLRDIDQFTQKGVYTITVHYPGSALLAESSTAPQQVLVGVSAGYAVLVQGKISSEEGLCSHAKTTNRIYQTLLDRGFHSDNIRYFNYLPASNCPLQPPATATDEGNWGKTQIQDAIESWAGDRMNGVPAPLYVVLVNHGTPEVFHIDDEEITPDDLDTWFGNLEANLNASALAEERQLILGACYSGSFIPKISAPGRTIVTSAAENEESYKGVLEPDDIRAGEFFLEDLFRALGRGESWRDAFESSTEVTEIYTRAGPDQSNGSNIYLDQAVQHPLLDDNGDGRGSNLLSSGDDGTRSAERYLGVGARQDTNAPDSAASIVQVSPGIYLSEADTSAMLWLNANDNSKVSSAWIEIREPSQELKGTGGSLQLDLNLHKELLAPVAGRWQWNLDDFFIEPGTYETYYSVRDNASEGISPMWRSMVYKAKPGNQMPGGFTLLTPVNGATTSTVLGFDWQDAVDPEQDPVTYNLRIATDAGMNDVLHQQLNLSSSTAFVDQAGDLQDLTDYYWQVEAVDAYGARRLSVIWSFHTDNTNGISGVITGLIYSDLAGQSIAAATVLNSLDGVQYVTERDGKFIIISKTGMASLTASKSGYVNKTVTGVQVEANKTVTKNIQLTPDHYLEINVSPVGVPNPAVSAGKVAMSVTATDSQSHSLSYTWSAACDGGDSGSFSNNKVRNPNWTAPVNNGSQVINCSISVAVSDGKGLSKSASYEQRVNNAQHRLTITALPNGTPNPVALGGKVKLSVSASDSLGHTINYVWSDSCNGQFNNTHIQTPDWTAPNSGGLSSCEITVVVSDGAGGLSEQRSFQQKLSSQTHSLRITQLPDGCPGAVKSAERVRLGVAADDSHAHQLNYRWQATCPAGGSGSFDNAGAFNAVWTAPSIGSGSAMECTMRVVIDDGLGGKQASESFQLQVHNYPHNACSSALDAQVNAGASYRVNASCTGKDSVSVGKNVTVNDAVNVIYTARNSVSFGNNFRVAPRATLSTEVCALP